MQTKLVLIGLACLLTASACAAGAHGQARKAPLCMAQPPVEFADASSDPQRVQASTAAAPVSPLFQSGAYLDAYPLLDSTASEWKALDGAYAQEGARTAP